MKPKYQIKIIELAQKQPDKLEVLVDKLVEKKLLTAKDVEIIKVGQSR